MSSLILYDMDNRTYSSAYPHLPLENMQVPGHSTVDTVVNPPLDAGTFLSGGPPALDLGHINSWSPNTPAYADNPQIDAVLGTSLVSADADTQVYPIELHPSCNVPRFHPLHSMQTAIVINLVPSKSILRGSECFGPTPATSNKDLTHVYLNDVDTTQNWVEQGVPTNVSFDQGHQYLSIDRTSDFSVPSTLPDISCTSAFPQRAPQKRPKQYQKTRKRPTAASSLSSGAPKGLYSCNICGCNRAQPQGLGLHYREKHFPNSCMYCRTFKWGRPYRYKEHLKKKHPGVDIGAALSMATGAPLKSITQYLSERFSHPAAECDRWDTAGSQLDAPIPPPPAPTRLSPTSLATASDLDCYPPPKSTELSTEEHAEDVNMSARSVRAWFQNVGQSAHRGGCTVVNPQVQPGPYAYFHTRPI